MKVSDIYAYLKDENYADLIEKLNKALEEDDTNPMYYFYRFLAYNHDYAHMNKDDVIGEIDLNKAIDLEEDYSFIKEYAFIKELEGNTKEIFIAVAREDTKGVNSLLKSSIEIREDLYPSFEEFLDNLEDKSLNLAVKVLNHNENVRKKLSSEMIDYLYCPDENSDYNLMIAGEDLIGVKGTPVVITIPEEVKVIKAKAFKGITSLRKVTMPKQLKEIEEEAFYECKNLHTIKLNKGLETIGDRAFSYTRITRIAIPKTITELGIEAFSYCTRLKQLRLPRTLYDIGLGAFKGCKSLRALSISLFNKTLGYVFGKEKYEGSYEANQGELKDSNEIYYIPEALENLTLVSYSTPDKVCQNCKSLRSVYFYQKVIPHFAFTGCNNLRNLVIQKNLSIIGKYAFMDCFNIEKFDIESCNRIFEGAFMNCKSLKSFGNLLCLQSLPSYVFKGCCNLTTVYFDSISEIGEQAFANCKSLKVLEFSYPLTNVEVGAFRECSNLEKIVLPSSVSYIGSGIFDGCGNLKSISMPMINRCFGEFFSKKYYENSVCAENGLSKYYFPKHLEEINIKGGFIPNHAFSGIESLNIVTLAGIEKIPWEAFFGCSNISCFIMDNHVTEINLHAFCGCKSLTKIFIPKSVKVIESGVFSFTPTKIYLERKKPLFGRPLRFKKGWCDKGTKIYWNQKRERVK